MWEYLLIGGLGMLLGLHWILEVHYFLRMALAVFLARFCRPRLSVLDTATYTSICTTLDVDALLFHMNNARYLRELDFARVDFYERTGLLRAIQAAQGKVFQGASTIRYRRFIRPFALYHITSKILYWEEDSIFMEHRFVTPSDGFVRAISLCKQRLVGINAEEILGACLAGFPKSGQQGGPKPPPPPRPEPPPDLAAWIQSNAISSSNLRNLV